MSMSSLASLVGEALLADLLYGELVQDGYALCFIFILLGHKNSLA